MKISYLVTCCNETDTLRKLIDKIYDNIGFDELIILQDESNWNRDRKKYLSDITELNQDKLKIISIPIIINPLNNNYGAHKNYGVEHCTGDFIFQIDGDEMPPDSLIGENLHALIESNPGVEAYAIPRINAWHGLTEAYKTHWNLDMSPTYKRLRAAWPDYQWRIFKRDYPRIQFKNRLHERIDGFNKFVVLPANEDYAIYHDKTIETQLKTNERYNRDFTVDENCGISAPK